MPVDACTRAAIYAAWVVLKIQTLCFRDPFEVRS
jgi:hypothetical protein